MQIAQPVRHLGLILCVFFGIVAEIPGAITEDVKDKINLALRRTADKLLRASGDSTSRIPAVEQVSEHVWQVRINQPFRYDTLPLLLQTSFEQYGIFAGYQVAVRRCDDGMIDLGFHHLDVVQDSLIPCTTRDVPEGCHYLEVTFMAVEENKGFLGVGMGSILLLIVLVGAVAWIWYVKQRASAGDTVDPAKDGNWLTYGRTRLNLTGHVVECNGVRGQLTYREAKLLNLFFMHPGELLERDRILREVWADEGVHVGRSIDMFVSRLRKKLKADPTIGIVAVHGVGYRMLMSEG